MGVVAQLGERVVRNDEVRGSIPLDSTRFSRNLIAGHQSFLRDDLLRGFMGELRILLGFMGQQGNAVEMVYFMLDTDGQQTAG